MVTRVTLTLLEDNLIPLITLAQLLLNAPIQYLLPLTIGRDGVESEIVLMCNMDSDSGHYSHGVIKDDK